MPLITIPGVTAAVTQGDEITLDWRTATLEATTGTRITGTPPNPRTVAIIEAGSSYDLLLAEHAPART